VPCIILGSLGALIYLFLSHGIDVNPGFGDLHFTFDVGLSAIECLDPAFTGGHFFGVLANSDIPNDLLAVPLPLTNVDFGNVAEEAAIWWFDINDLTTGQLFPFYTKPDSTTVSMFMAYNALTDSLALVADIEDLLIIDRDWVEVFFFIIRD